MHLKTREEHLAPTDCAEPDIYECKMLTLKNCISWILV